MDTISILIVVMVRWVYAYVQTYQNVCSFLYINYISVKLRNGEGNGTPLQYSCLESPTNLVGYSPWGRKESDTTERLHFHFHFHALEKEVATHSSVFAWRILGMGEPGGLPSMGSHRVGHDCSDLAAAAAKLRKNKRGRLAHEH